MSQTPHIGVVGAKYWLFMAHAMRDCLQSLINGKETTIPINVFRDARTFFQVVLEQKTNNVIFNNSLARGDAQEIALRAWSNCPRLWSQIPGAAFEHFHKFAGFLERLETQPTVPLDEGKGKQITPPLGEENQKTAADLHDFFNKLKTGGENEEARDRY